MKQVAYLLALIFFVSSCDVQKEGAEPIPKPAPPPIVGQWKMKSYKVDPPVLGIISDLTGVLNPCILKVTFHFREDGTTTLLNVPADCEADLVGIDLDKQGISKWEIKDKKLIISSDDTGQKNEYDFVVEGTKMTWNEKRELPIPVEWGGNQKVNTILTFEKI